MGRKKRPARTETTGQSKKKKEQQRTASGEREPEPAPQTGASRAKWQSTREWINWGSGPRRSPLDWSIRGAEKPRRHAAGPRA